MTLEKTTVIRLAYYNKEDKRIDTTISYIIEDRTISLPIVMVTVAPKLLWDFDQGVYVKGCCADSIHPYYGANYWRDKELEINLQYIDEGQVVINQNCGMKIFGGWSRVLPQKSLAFYARNKYGNPRFEYTFFPEKPQLKKFKGLIIRNSGSDFNKTQYRDALITQVAKQTGIDYQAYQPTVVYINGEYFGIQNLREKINEYYLQSNHKKEGVDRNNVDLIKRNLNVKAGSAQDYRELKKLLNQNLRIQENYDLVTKKMDVDNYAKYNATEIFFDNVDAGGNVRYWRPKTENSKWKWILFDTDFGMGLDTIDAFKRNSVKNFTTKSDKPWPYPNWSTFIIRRLITNKGFKNMYLNTFADLLNETFSYDNIKWKNDSILNLIEDEVPYHFFKWKNVSRKYDDNWPEPHLEKWKRHIKVLDKFSRNRHHWVRKHLMERFNIKDTFKLIISDYDKFAGQIQINSLKINGSWEGIYFRDIPVNIKAIEGLGFRFVGWKEFKDSSNYLRISNSDTILKITPVFRKRRSSKFFRSIVINEFSKKRKGVKNDWIELYNKSKKPIDISYWTLVDKNPEHKYIFPANTVIQPNDFIVLYQKESLGVKNEIGPFNFGLSSKEDAIRVFDSEKNLVDEIWYDTLWKENHYALYNPKRRNQKQKNWRIEEETIGKINKSYHDLLVYLKSRTHKIETIKNTGVGFTFFGVLLLLIFGFLAVNKSKK